MENQIVSSQFKLLGTCFNNSNITIDLGVVLLALSLVVVAVLGFKVIKYLRDKNGIIDCSDVEELKCDVKYNSRYIKSLEQRIVLLENKDESVTELYKLVKELKTLVKKKL